MKRYPGGTAVMVPIPLHDSIRLCEWTNNWLVAQKNHWTAVAPKDYHMTLQFVGRDLDAAKVAWSIMSAFTLAVDVEKLPLRFTGAYRTNVTGKGSYLVAEIETDETLLKTRNDIRDILAEMGVIPKDSFKFAPHVTVAEAIGKSIPGLPEPFEPFTAECNEIVVKYGRHRMTVDL